MNKNITSVWRAGAAVWAILILAPLSGRCAEPEPIPWQALEEEGIGLLSRYIQIDTTNPPGNEIKAAQFFKQIFDREGIEARIIESAPGRGNIFARLRGNGSKKAVLLMNHMDVVPADTKFWKEPPFSGAVKDGYVWGRGALDMKGPAILESMSLMILKRHNVTLNGDIIFLGTADEEAGGAMGAGFLLQHHSELFKNVGLVLNEGGGIEVDDQGRARYYRVGLAEKTPLWLKLTASGNAGHGSTPGNNLAVNKLVAALYRVMRYQSPIRVVSQVQKYYADIASLEPVAQRQQQYRDLRKALQDPAFVTEFTRDARNNASVRNTISLTAIKGSDKVNVIPAQASAEIDIRLLPGDEPEAFIKTLRKIIADDSIKIEILLSFPPATSPPHPEAMRIIGELAKTHDGGAPVIAPLGRGFTDCHFFRERGIPCYGFMPRRTGSTDGRLVHGVDERVSIENLKFGIRAMYEMVRKLVAE